MATQLTKTLIFQLECNGDEQLLHEAYVEARNVYNETIRLAKTGLSWTEISSKVEDEAALVKNTTQRIVAKAYNSYEQYLTHDDYNEPSHTKFGPYPLRMNFTEGYTLTIEDEEIRFRVSAKPYKPVTGTLRGAPEIVALLQTAIES
ncbi:hypothetical protein [Haladaptatus sp. YSMS36]|uniref:hypothetical protein n=1 Tax=Haladaptatus sp. YSMS36 TaxID=3033384 RepID=UPI0023E78DB3|nr:hypothetical protein [Haladaptatus sp. YSMS36]